MQLQQQRLLLRAAVPSLADIQRSVRRAVVTGDAAGLEPLLAARGVARERLAIHHRHYETSLVTALLGKFPATTWLVGTPFLTEAATRFVLEHPPKAPCIAEYGEDFPAFLSSLPGADRVPYLEEFAGLEWHLVQVSVAADRPAMTLEEFLRLDLERLPEATLSLQGGLRYLEASWPIDDLMKLYLTNTAPDQWSMDPAHVYVEVRGARGEMQINRLGAGEFAFRKAILDGRSIGDASELGIASCGDFDPGSALAALVADGLVTAVEFETRGDARGDDR